MTIQIQNRKGTVNGVDVDALVETIQTVKNNPRLAQSRFSAVNQWVDGGLNRATITDFYSQEQTIQHVRPFVITADEPPALLGKDQGANPVEILLAALSACMTTTLAYYSAGEGIRLDRISSEYEGDIDLTGFLGINDRVRKGYSEIRVKFKVKGDIAEDKVITFLKCSPVYDVVSRGTPVKITVEKV